MNPSAELNLRTALSLIDDVIPRIEPLKEAIAHSDSAWDASAWQGLKTQFAIGREAANLSKTLDEAIVLAASAASSNPNVTVTKHQAGEDLEMTPDSLRATALVGKALLHAFQGRLQDAENCLQESIRLFPTADAQLRLASVKAAQGDRDAAQAAFGQVIEIYPDSAEAVEALKAQRELERARPKKRTTALILSITLGLVGADRFYLGYYGLGTVKLLTVGGVYIWWLLDIVRIATNSLRDANGMKLEK